MEILNPTQSIEQSYIDQLEAARAQAQQAVAHLQAVTRGADTYLCGYWNHGDVEPSSLPETAQRLYYLIDKIDGEFEIL